MLEKVKNALRLTVNIYDDELQGMIEAAYADLGIAGIAEDKLSEVYPIITMAVITYCRFHFGSPTDYDNLKASYDEQKAQLQTATGFGFPEDGGCLC